MLKFGRTYSLRVQTVDNAMIEVKNPFTLEFAVKRSTLASANTGAFKITNLAPETRNRIYHDKYDTLNFKSVELRAGYGSNDPLIFKGNVKEAQSYREEGSTSVITSIDGYDGGFALVNAFSSWTLNGPKSKQEVIAQFLNDMARQPGVELGAVSVFGGTYPRGRSVCAPTAGLLATETGNRFYIDNGRMYCLRDDDSIQGDIAVISADTGLLGSPRRADTFITCEILFEPRFLIGQLVELRSNVNTFMNGIYKVMGIEHYGTISDAVGGKCKTIVNLWVGDLTLQAIRGQGVFAGGI